MIKKTIAVLLTAAMILVLTCCGKENKPEEPEELKRFDIELNEVHGIGGNIYIIKDKETGNEYLFVKSGYGGGLTKLEGKQ